MGPPGQSAAAIYTTIYVSSLKSIGSSISGRTKFRRESTRLASHRRRASLIRRGACSISSRCALRWSRLRSCPFRRRAMAAPSSSSPSWWRGSLPPVTRSRSSPPAIRSRRPASRCARASTRAVVAARAATSSSITRPGPPSRSSPTRAASTSCTRTCRRRCRSRRMLDAPMVYTVHHDDGDDYAPTAVALPSQPRALRRHQRAPAQLMPELADARVIHHGLDPTRSSVRRRRRRLLRVPRPLRARQGAARGDRRRARRRRAASASAARRTGGDHDYFERELRARLSLPGVTAVGEVGGRRQARASSPAPAPLLFPVDWEEPFGLVMIEAMLSGTPVLAFGRGSVPRDRRGRRDRLRLPRRRRDGGAPGARSDASIARRCRRRALERWTTARMVRDYLAVYEALATWVGDVRAAETVA